jgi:membrane fusion protein, multidrug efflux system
MSKSGPLCRGLLAAALAVLATAAIAQPLPSEPGTTGSALANREIRAQLMPRRYVTLAAEIGAKISQLPIAEGGTFRAGQLLLALDCALPAAQLQRAKAAFVLAEKTYAGNRRLTELKSIGQMELDISEAEVAKANAERAASEAVLSKCRIVAPFAGRIAEQKVREQQYVQPGQALLDIIDDSVLELEFIAPSQWLAWVKPGSPLQVRIDETGRTYPATVQRIGARVDPVSQSIKLVAVPEGIYPELMAGMSGRILLPPVPAADKPVANAKIPNP